MNPADVRFRISRLLSQEPGIVQCKMIGPVVGEKLALEVTVNDPYAPNPSVKSQRKYKVTIEEIDVDLP